MKLMILTIKNLFTLKGNKKKFSIIRRSRVKQILPLGINE